LRWFVFLPLGLLAAGALLAWIGWEALNYHFDKRVREFDLKDMEKMEAASIIYDRNDKEIGKIFILNRNPVPLDQVSKYMVEAVIAAEDNKFYEHDGVDYMGVLRAAIANYRRGKISQGASTVTQQLARNSYELKERTYQRKILEVFLARYIEQHLSKDKIMELYLNRVYFGSGLYGVEAAARGYFGRSAKDLDISQSAMLAGLLKSPQALSPWNNLDAARQTRNFVLKRMREQGFITRDEYNIQVDLPLYVIKRTNPFKVSYAIDYVRQQAISALGYEQAMNGGFKIKTTLDASMQRAAEIATKEVIAAIESRPGYDHETFAQYRNRVADAEARLNKGDMSVKLPDPKYLQGAVYALNSSTGGILAMVGGREFKHSEYNRATQARRPVGTAFTPIVFATAFEKGIFPGELVEDACIDNRYVGVGGESRILGEWGVERVENDYEGPMPMREALAKGKNAAAVRVGLRVGIDAVRQLSTKLGIESPLRGFSNAFLGSSEVTLSELTMAYTAFGNGGVRPQTPYVIDSIEDASGKKVFSTRAKRVNAMSREAAFQVHTGLVDTLMWGTASEAFGRFGLKNVPAAGKTGTAYNFTDTYFVGYNSSVTCGVWVGFDRPTKIFRGAFGKDLALPIWTKVMNAAAESLPAVDFVRPETQKEVQICRSSGLLATPKCVAELVDARTGETTERSLAFTEYATEAQMPQVRCDVHGGGIRSYTKEFNEDQWPRAMAAVDLSTIRPVAVTAPALLGLTDVYGSVKPGSGQFDESIPVARAIPVNAVEGEQPAEGAPAAEAVPVAVPASAESATPVATATTNPQTPQSPGTPSEAPAEIRKAQAVGPLDSALEAPMVPAPTPAPINF
jgi:1A family penicillin-binding protein